MSHAPDPIGGPVVMWRMQRAGGLSSHLAIVPKRHGTVAAWFLNGHAQGARHFDDVRLAIQFSERMQFQNWAVGWRLVPDRDDVQ
jgi:hypothetical protein